jgi:two-component system cell cycle sensor histidine kinase/response regulator CckA
MDSKAEIQADAAFSARIVRTLRSLLILAVVGAAYPASANGELSWRFWATLGVLMISNLFFAVRRVNLVASPRLSALIFLLDMSLLGYLLYELGERTGEFYVVFAMALLVGAVGRSVAGALAGSAVAGLLYALLAYQGKVDTAFLSMAFLTRLAFFFAFTLFIAHLAREAERSRRTARVMESALEENRRSLDAIVETAPLLVAVTDAEGRIVLFNKACEELTGYSRREVLGRSMAEMFVLPEHHQAVPSGTDRLPATDTGSIGITWKMKSGELRSIEWRRAILPSEAVDRQCLLHLGLDVTERRRAAAALRAAREQLLHAQKMEAMGRLAGGIAHDFNNMLSTIIGFGELARRKMEPEHPVRHFLDEILASSDRAAQLTRQLLTFSRRHVVTPQVLDLNDVVTETNDMLQRLIEEPVLIRTDLRSRSPRVKADRGQIDQLILNLAVNARDAMPAGGTLTIETSDATIDEAGARRMLDVTPGPYVGLTISDTGCGMDAQVKAHLFEPYFTTKEKGRGTGLGLSIVYGIVKQGGGHIEIESEPGQGTRVRLLLPRTDETPAPPSIRKIPAVPQRVPETVLLVEDDGMVRSMAREVLAEMGCAVLTASGGPEALDLAARHEGPIHLLLTDVVMPKMSGLEVARAVTERRPETRVLLMSGYLGDALPHEAAQHALLQKPFTPDDLARKVREALETGAGAADRAG